jgi:hypothetical protein
MSSRDDGLSDSLESELRFAAPVLPPALKSQTLALCASRVAAKRQREVRRNRFIGCVLCALVMSQWIGVSVIDGENHRLMAGDRVNTPLTTVTFAQAVEALQDRAKLYMAWLQETTNRKG